MKERNQLTETFGFTEQENLFDRISHDRFMALLQDEQTTVLSADVSSNLYGEFLFITMSRVVGEQPIGVTFFGLGFHEHRERWIADEWFWYQASIRSGTDQKPLLREDVLTIVTTRQNEVASYAQDETQSQRGRFFEMLADLTDEDGALTDMEDLGDLDWLNDE